MRRLNCILPNKVRQPAVQKHTDTRAHADANTRTRTGASHTLGHGSGQNLNRPSETPVQKLRTFSRNMLSHFSKKEQKEGVIKAQNLSQQAAQDIEFKPEQGVFRKKEGTAACGPASALNMAQTYKKNFIFNITETVDHFVQHSNDFLATVAIKKMTHLLNANKNILYNQVELQYHLSMILSFLESPNQYGHYDTHQINVHNQAIKNIFANMQNTPLYNTHDIVGSALHHINQLQDPEALNAFHSLANNYDYHHNNKELGNQDNLPDDILTFYPDYSRKKSTDYLLKNIHPLLDGLGSLPQTDIHNLMHHFIQFKNHLLHLHDHHQEKFRPELAIVQSMESLNTQNDFTKKTILDVANVVLQNENIPIQQRSKEFYAAHIDLILDGLQHALVYSEPMSANTFTNYVQNKSEFFLQKKENFFHEMVLGSHPNPERNTFFRTQYKAKLDTFIWLLENHQNYGNQDDLFRELSYFLSYERPDIIIALEEKERDFFQKNDLQASSPNYMHNVLRSVTHQAINFFNDFKEKGILSRQQTHLIPIVYDAISGQAKVVDSQERNEEGNTHTTDDTIAFLRGTMRFPQYSLMSATRTGFTYPIYAHNAHF